MKKYKKYKVKYWNNLFVQSYGVNVDIIIYKSEKLLNKWAKKYKKVDLPTQDGSLGSVLPIGNNNYAIFLKQDIAIDTIVHECVHVTQFVFNYVGMYSDGIRSMALMEAEAYFTGALFTEVLNRVKKYVSLEYNWITVPKQIK